MRLLHIAFAFIALAAVFPAQAQETDRLVKVRLLPEYGLIEPGEQIWIGIEQSIAPEWHTYWKNPGDSGAAPRVKWVLPDGFEIGEIEWPIPARIPYGPLLNYGYSDHVILLQKLQAPDTLPPGPIALRADVEILVCKDECIPEYGRYELLLNGPESAAEDNNAYLEAAAAALPMEIDWSPAFGEDQGKFRLTIPVGDDWKAPEIEAGRFEFFPEDWGLVKNAAALSVSLRDKALMLEQERGDRPLSAVENMRGVLAYTAPDGSRKALSFTAKKGDGGVAGAQQMPEPQNTGFWQALLLALLGGMVLNLMPCVFPVLSLKALSLVKIAEKHPELARLHGLAYTAGVVLSFVLIAGILIALKSGGAGIGWGFQLQNPVIVTLLAYLLFIIGLNLSGVFEISGALGHFGNKFTQGDGLSSSFFTGILATLVATPCTAPFMAAAIGFALVQPALAALSIFAALGFGLALPYLLLSFVPALRSILPKPGAWMEIFRQLLAFPMFASAAWLIWVMSQQAGTMGVLGALMGLVAIAFGFWLLNHRPANLYWNFKVKILALVSFAIALSFLPAGQIGSAPQAQYEAGHFGEAFTPEKLSVYLEGRDPVFVEMTAAWCITCKVNHAVAIDTDATRLAFEEHQVKYLIGDWTNQDPQITEFLKSYGRSGVPLYVYFGPPDENGQRPAPFVLPQVLTPGSVKEILEK